MHKKLATELMSLAHSILQMKNKDDVGALQEKAHEVYEKLSVLKFVENYSNTTSSLSESETAHIKTVKTAIVAEAVVEKITSTVAMPPKEEVNATEEIPNAEVANNLQLTLEEEFKEAVTANEAAEIFDKSSSFLTEKEGFEKAVEVPETLESTEIIENKETKKQSLNDTLFKDNIQVDLNDRIAFVKNLFEGNQEDFNRANALGVANYGQMTAGGWMYIGPQGIVHGTYNTILIAGRMKLGVSEDGDLKGKMFVSSGLGGMSGAQPKAVEIANGVGIFAEVDLSRIETRHSQGWVMEKTDSPKMAFSIEG